MPHHRARGHADVIDDEIALRIEAARQAKFKPALKDGKPVPHWVVLEMGFNLR